MAATTASAQLCEVVSPEHAPLWASPRNLADLAIERRRSFGELGMYLRPLGLGNCCGRQNAAATERVRRQSGAAVATLSRGPYCPPSTFFVFHRSQLQRLLASFHRLDGDGSGRIELDEFAAALGLQDAPAGYVQRLFSFFDADGAGDISFAELVQGLAVLSPSCSMEEKLKLAFLTCDMDASGGVSLSNLQGVIEYAVARDVSLAAAASAAAPRPAASAEPPLLARSPSVRADALAAAFAKHDRDGNKLLDYEEWCAFVGEHADLLQLNLDVAADRMGALGDLALTVPTMKAERQASRVAATRGGGEKRG